MKGIFKKELGKVIKIAPLQFFYLFIVTIFTRGFLLIIPVVFGTIIEYVTNADYSKAIFLLIILLIITFTYRLAEMLYQIAYFKVYNRIYSHYNGEVLEKTVNNSMFSLSRFTTGAYTNIVITDVDVISAFFTNGVNRFLQMLEYIIIYAYFLSLDIVIFISAIIILFVMILISFKYGNVLQKLSEKRKSSVDDMSAGIYSFFNNIKEIKSYHIYGKMENTREQEINKYLKKNAKYNRSYNISNQIFLYVFEAFRLLTVLYGLFLVQKGQFAVGTLLIIYNYYQKIIDNFTALLTTNLDYRNVVVSLNRYYRLVEYSKNAKKGIVLDKNQIRGSIEFKNILYGFRDNPMLNYASMEIKENSITVLTGRDEAAQNGVYDLLLRLNRQHEGTIHLDDYNIEDIDEDSFYKIISTARKNSNLFDTTIKNNFIAINDDFDKVVEISKRIGLHSKIMKLNDGYDTILTDTTPISQNTKLLLIIERCFLKDAKIILMDDIINSLNEEHEKLVMNYLEELKKDHTIVIISNSSEIISKADNVLDIDDKKILNII